MPSQERKTRKKRAASDPDVQVKRVVDGTGRDEDRDGILVDDDPTEPTMGEKLASLKLLDNERGNRQETEDSTAGPELPSANSINVLLKQALHADDRALLLECLYNRDDKVIANSIALLTPSDVLKLLHALVTVIQSRGAVLACALPWMKSLLLQHASKIMSQESSLLALNSVYQLIESRVSTFQTAIGISSFLETVYPEALGDMEEEPHAGPIVYEDKDDSEEEERGEGSQPDEDYETEGSLDEEMDIVSDFEGIEDMSD